MSTKRGSARSTNLRNCWDLGEGLSFLQRRVALKPFSALLVEILVGRFNLALELVLFHSRSKGEQRNPSGVGKQ